MHVIERFRREGNTLTRTATVEDPDVLLEPWTTTPRERRIIPLSYSRCRPTSKPPPRTD